MDGVNSLNKHYDYNDTNSGDQDFENFKPPDLELNPCLSDNHETFKSDQCDDNIHLEECSIQDSGIHEVSSVRNEKVVGKEDDINGKACIGIKGGTVTSDNSLGDSFEHQQNNILNTQQYQDNCTLNLSIETLNPPSINTGVGNTLLRTNTLNECTSSNVESSNGLNFFDTGKMVANEEYSGNSSNKELLELNDSKNLQVVKPDLKQSEVSLGNINFLSNQKFDSCVDSSSIEISLVDVSVDSSLNSLPLAGKVESNNNASLAQLQAYESDGEESANEASNVVILEYREDKNQVIESDEESDSDSSSTCSASKIISETESDEEYENYTNLVPHKPIKAKKELGLEDLPPIEDLKISVAEEDCIPVGKVYQIVDQLVVVEALKGVPAYDLDTVLFLEGGQPLGKVFDVFGPVAEPYYCVRFNSRDHITEKNIHLNQTVYSAPNTKHTNYVFLQQLMILKGSDASWVDDDEPPEVCIEYSDDEQERIARKKKSRSGKASLNAESDPDEPARKKHFAYEERMNARNLQLSAAKRHPHSSTNKSQYFKNNLWSTTSASPGLSNRPNTHRPPGFQNVSHQLFGRPPMFNKMGFPFPPPPFRCATPFQDLPNAHFIQNTQPSLANHNSPSPFPQQISQWRPQFSNNGEPLHLGSRNVSSPGPSAHIHSSINSNVSGFNPNSTNWRQTFPAIGISSINSPPPPLHSPVVPNNSFCSSPFWTPQTKPPFPDTNNKNPRLNFSRLGIFPPSRPITSVQSSQNAPPINPLGIGFNPNVPPPRPYSNSFEMSPNISSTVTFNSNVPPPPPLPTSGPNTSAALINFNRNIPPPSQNPFNL